MKSPGFLEGVGVALIAAVSGEVLFTVLPWFIGEWLAGLFIISLLTLSYLLYLLRRAPERTGRVTLLALWGLTSLAAVALGLATSLYLLLQLGFIWLTRALYFRASLFGALADLGLHALAASAAVWAFTRSGSLFLALWSFFLVEALFPLIPGTHHTASTNAQDEGGVNPRFEQAHRTAVAALHRLTTR